MADSTFMAEDYYKTLGVSRSASDEEIQKAYRKLARKYHPDLSDDKKAAKENFQKVQHAYDVLSDPKKRQLYDQLGPDFDRAGGFNPYQGGAAPGGMEVDLEQIFGKGRGGEGPGGFDEILRQVFGGAGPQPGPQAGSQFGGGPFGPRPQPTRGQDIEQEITIPFATSILGGKHQVSLKRSSGKVENITITIPAGIQQGKKIRLRGQGQSLPTGGPRGDLFVKVNIASHPIYKRQGSNLLVDVPVTVTEAALGAKIDLGTPHGTVTLTVPPGSNSGKLLRMKGMGVKSGKGTDGDLIAELQIVLPAKIDDADRQLFEQLGNSYQIDPRSGLKW